MDKVLRSDVLLRERPALRKGSLLRLTMPEEGAVRENRRAGQARYRMALSAPGGRGRDRGRMFFGRTAEPTGAVSGKRTVPPPEKGKAAQRHSAAAGWLCGIAKAKKPFQKKQGGASSGRKPVEKGGTLNRVRGAMKNSGRAAVSECRKSGGTPLFRAFTGFASRIRSRAAKPARYENLWVFIRSDALVVRAGWNIRGCGPLSTPGFFDRRKTAAEPLF